MSKGRGKVYRKKKKKGLEFLFYSFSKASFVCWKVVSFWKVNFEESEF